MLAQSKVFDKSKSLLFCASKPQVAQARNMSIGVIA